MSDPLAVNGQRQSPIDINTSQCAECATSNKPLIVNFPPQIRQSTIVNSGHGWRVDIPKEEASKTALQGGPLDDDQYILEQFHCHWGRDCNCGSEHTIDGKCFAGELHLVHWNSSKFASFGEAASQDRGLSVLGVFLDIGDQPHAEFDKLIQLLSSIKYKDQKAAIDGDLCLNSFLPNDRSYWAYEGSLTTPPFSESVSWVVFKEAIKVTSAQIESFRSLYHVNQDNQQAGQDCTLKENYRVPQAINERKVSYFK